METTKKCNNKGQAAESVGAIITLITGIGIAVLVLIFVGSLGGQTYNLIEDDINDIANNQVVAESFIANNITFQTLTHHFIQQDSFVIYNDSEELGLNNFSIDYDLGTILLISTVGGADQGVLNSTTNYINYTWGAIEVRNSVQEGIISGFSALETTGNYMPIIVLAVTIALVLALVLGMGVMGVANKGGGSAL